MAANRPIASIHFTNAYEQGEEILWRRNFTLKQPDQSRHGKINRELSKRLGALPAGTPLLTNNKWYVIAFLSGLRSRTVRDYDTCLDWLRRRDNGVFVAYRESQSEMVMPQWIEECVASNPTWRIESVLDL